MTTYCLKPEYKAPSFYLFSSPKFKSILVLVYMFDVCQTQFVIFSVSIHMVFPWHMTLLLRGTLMPNGGGRFWSSALFGHCSGRRKVLMLLYCSLCSRQSGVPKELAWWTYCILEVGRNLMPKPSIDCWLLNLRAI